MISSSELSGAGIGYDFAGISIPSEAQIETTLFDIF